MRRRGGVREREWEAEIERTDLPSVINVRRSHDACCIRNEYFWMNIYHLRLDIGVQLFIRAEGVEVDIYERIKNNNNKMRGWEFQDTFLVITDGQLDCLQQVLYGLILAEKIISTSLKMCYSSFFSPFFCGLCWTMLDYVLSQSTGASVCSQ